MKNLNKFISERLHITKNSKISESDPNDPTNWIVGDIVCCTAGYSMCLPRFYKITRKTPKGIVVKRMPGKIISGHHNGLWKEIADENGTLGEEFKGRIVQRGTYSRVKIDGNIVHLWDGEPLFGDDMD